MPRFIFLSFLVLCVNGILLAQEIVPLAQDSSQSESSRFTPFTLHNPAFDQSFLDFELSALDTMPAPRQRRLLPPNMSFMEKGLWGEDGMMRSIGLASPLTPESRMKELDLRRGMLVAHQIGGFVTLGFMLSAVYAGQKIIDGNPGFRPYHQAFVAGTITSYSLTGLLAVLSPPPLIRRDEVSTTTIHKTLAWVHFAGMVVTPILGSMINRRSTSTQQEHFHQISGYITTAAFAAALITVTF
jgi:hypothetical protein